MFSDIVEIFKLIALAITVGSAVSGVFVYFINSKLHIKEYSIVERLRSESKAEIDKLKAENKKEIDDLKENKLNRKSFFLTLNELKESNKELSQKINDLAVAIASISNK